MRQSCDLRPWRFAALGLAIAATACTRDSGSDVGAQAGPATVTTPIAADMSDVPSWPRDTGKLEWPLIAMSVTDVPLRQAATVAADKAHFTLENPDALPEKTVSMHFDAVSSRSVFAIIADEAKMNAMRAGDRIRFEPSSSVAPARR